MSTLPHLLFIFLFHNVFHQLYLISVYCMYPHYRSLPCFTISKMSTIIFSFLKISVITLLHFFLFCITHNFNIASLSSQNFNIASLLCRLQCKNLNKKGDYQMHFHKLLLRSLSTMSSLTQALRLHKVNVSFFEKL